MKQIATLCTTVETNASELDRVGTKREIVKTARERQGKF